MVEKYNVIAEQSESTVMAHYDVPSRDAEAYQSEAALEDMLIRQLVSQGYDYPKINDEAALVDNLRRQLERLNGYRFSDAEWGRFMKNDIANESYDIEAKTKMIQKDDTVIEIKRDNGETKNITLIDKRNHGNNCLQVINQYVPEGGTSKNRYDVTILVNGLPMVHIELKRRGVSIREAFNQIDRYQRESFWAGKALFEYVQLFVISNGTQTKYYSNTTRMSREKEADKMKIPGRKIESNSFEFTSYWTDADNKIISDLEDFAKTFLKKSVVMNMLTKYCVFTVDNILLAMRPYQIAATERILLRIRTAILNRWQGTEKAGGYIWHTTGSGKTLTSYKTAQLATKIDGVEKVLFVVDRQDLDYQTMKEYNNFEPNCANGSTKTDVLRKQLADKDAKILITTIQKLSNVLKDPKKYKAALEELYGKNVVFIFDECHRSQFGKMRKKIRSTFKKYIMFGFTGTPIFAENANASSVDERKTTEQVFGEQLHSYNIIDAIRDKNVLKFHVDYIKTVKKKGDVEDEMVTGIEGDKILHDEQRVRLITKYILEHFKQKTKRSDGYSISKLMNVEEIATAKDQKKVEEVKQKTRTKGFNSIFAVDSVDMARAFYMEMKRQMEKLDKKDRLTIATIFTHEANEEENKATGAIEEDPEGINDLEPTSKEFLKNIAIPDYNAIFKTEYDVDSEKFQNYYKDISLRMKNKDIDILIVVGMFLTGFDAKTLNTLWVDKNLKMHGLLQAYSRTNRILNSVKNCGNIVSFRNLEPATNECFALFGNKDAKGIVIMRQFDEYYRKGYHDENGKYHESYVEIVKMLTERFPVDKLTEVIEDKEKNEFIKLFGYYLKMYNLLTSFDEFCPSDIEKLREIRILNERARQDYMSWYNSLYEEYKRNRAKGERADVSEDVEFEIELVKQVQIDITFILSLVEKYKASQCQDKEVLVSISKSITSSPDLRNKKELIERFIDSITPEAGEVHEEWDKYLEEEKERQLNDIITEEKLKSEKTKTFVERAFKDGYIEESGTAVTEILPPMPLFGAGNMRQETKFRVIKKLKEYFERFTNI